MTWDVLVGDCLDVMQTLPPDSVDAVVCDPPYGLEFMGKDWDGANGFRRSLNPDDANRPNVFGRTSTTSPEYRTTTSHANSERLQHSITYQDFCFAWATEVLRVLKPGGHLLAFGGTRTSHRMICAIEDAGFEIRDKLDYLYGSGFPKSLDVSKALDKAAGIERDVLGYEDPRSSIDRIERTSPAINQHWREAEDRTDVRDLSKKPITEPQSDLAKQWDGWGTALKPAHEDIVLARKPLIGTVATNVTRYGTGALNIDACRIAITPTDDIHQKNPHTTNQGANNIYGVFTPGTEYIVPQGRWPTNILLDEEAAAMLDAQSGTSQSRIGIPRSGRNGDGWGMTATGTEYADSGGPSRFFYCAKASRSEREEGLSHLPTQTRNRVNPGGIEHDPKWAPIQVKNHHPTVKPIDLMRWLITLVTPPGGLVLDPFTGSGSTGVAAVKGGWSFLGIEQDEGYADIARARIAHAVPHQIALF